MSHRADLITAAQAVSGFAASASSLAASEQHANLLDAMSWTRDKFVAVAGVDFPFPGVDPNEGVHIYAFIADTDAGAVNAFASAALLKAAFEGTSGVAEVTQDAPIQLWNVITKQKLKFHFIAYFS